MNINNIIILLRDWAGTAGVPSEHLLNEAASRIETEARLADELAEVLGSLAEAGEKLLKAVATGDAGTAVRDWEQAYVGTLLLWKWRQHRVGDALPKLTDDGWDVLENV